MLAWMNPPVCLCKSLKNQRTLPIWKFSLKITDSDKKKTTPNILLSCIFKNNILGWTIGIQLLLYTGVTEEVWACQVAQWVKNLPAMQEIKETWGQSLSQGDPLEEGMATHSSIPAWRILPTDRGASWATVHGMTKSQTQLKWLGPHASNWGSSLPFS